MMVMIDDGDDDGDDDDGDDDDGDDDDGDDGDDGHPHILGRGTHTPCKLSHSPSSHQCPFLRTLVHLVYSLLQMSR